MARLPRAHGGRRTIGRACLGALLAACILPIPGVEVAPDRASIDVRPPAASISATLDTDAALASDHALAGPTQPTGPTLNMDAAVAADATPADATPADATLADATLPSYDTLPADAAGPSTAYEQAMAHAEDDIEFEPGARVTKGFEPRSNDAWPIDGTAPAALPAGRVTGKDMAASLQGSTWATLGAGDRPTAGKHIRAPVGTREPAASDPGETTTPTDTTDSRLTPIRARSIAATTPEVAPAVSPDPEPGAAAGARRQVFGFLPYWELSNASSKLNFDVLSTIAYFSVGANGQGELRKRDADGSSSTGWSGWTSSNMTKVINTAHKRGTRVVLTISVFAWSNAQASVQRTLLGSASARRTFARQAAAAVRDRGADGINLDFEPLASGYESEFVALLKSIRSELNKVRRGYQLTYDTTGFAGNYPLAASVRPGAADAIFIMGYDYRTYRAGTSGSIDPLSGPGYDLADTIRSYTARVSPKRLILGLPWYGRAWSTTSDKPRAANRSGAKYGYSTAINYESLVDYVRKYGRRWDPVEQSPYVAYRRKNCTSTDGCVTTWRQIWYDDAQSTMARLALVNDYGLRGAGVWALGYDGGHAELYRAFAESFLTDKAAPQAGITAVASTQGDEGFIVAWNGRDTSRITSYDVQVSVDGGSWKDWLDHTKATSEVYSGADGHGYAFRVRARDSKGNSGAYTSTQVWTASPALKANGFGRVTKDGLAYRSGPGTGTVRLGSLKAGTIVALTRGPVHQNGYTWFEVTQPIREWPTVSFVERGVWIATARGSQAYVRPIRSPASTQVSAGIRRLDFGSSGTSGTGTAAAALAVRAFSPDGDGSEDGITIRWTSSVRFDRLTLRVFRADGKELGSVALPGSATGTGSRSFTWDGRIGGRRVADGRYQVQLVGTRGGSTWTAPSRRPVTASQLARYALTVDTSAPRLVAASASGSVLSPNHDGRADSVKLALSAAGGAVRWSITIAAKDGKAVRTTSGAGTHASYTWTGVRDGGIRVRDGSYTATVSAWDAAGNRATRTFPITLDTTAPAVTTSASLPVFSPNGDAALEATGLATQSTEKASGTARMYHGTRLVKAWNVSDARTWSATWNGRSSAGTALADGRYTLKVTVRDAAGNERTASTRVVIDRTAASLRWAGDFYPQDGDKIGRTSALGWTLSRAASTTLRLYDERGTLVRTVWKARTLKAGKRTWTWDGRLANGTWAPQGLYTARLTVTSSLGSVTLDRDVRAAAFTVSPSATVVKPGGSLKVTVRAIEPVSGRPKVTFTQPGRSGVTVTATRLSNGSFRATFTVRSGRAGMAAIMVAGKDAGGGRNTTQGGVRVAS